MGKRQASCCCGKLRLSVTGEPIRISMCHCLDCQRRTGSVFGVQARFPRDAVTVNGESARYRRVADSGNGITFSFCPSCGSTVYYEPEAEPDTVAVPVGAFADPTFPPPKVSVYDSRRHRWVEIPDTAERLD